MNDSKLIDLVEAQPSIYNKTDIFYSNKEHVRSIWQMIAGEMQQEVPVCQKRWRYLRDYFVRQLHLTEENNIMNHAEGEDQQVVTFRGKRSFWPLYDRLSFLKPFSSTRRKMKRTSTHEVTSQALKIHDDDLNYSQFINSEGSDRSRLSSSTSVSGNYVPDDTLSNTEFLRFYQAMQMAAQQSLNSNNNGYKHDITIESDESPVSKRKRHLHDPCSDMPQVFQQVDYAIDEHDCFFKSILSSVRRISDEHIIAFRTEILQVLMKFRNLSETTDNECSDLENKDEINGNDGNDEDIVVVNTEEAHWRKNLFRKQL